MVDAQGETLGKIEDLMLDVETGRVAYAVLSFGGYMGMGDKLFAMPWQALHLDRDSVQSHRELSYAPDLGKRNAPATVFVLNVCP